jgi:spore coat protein U-like protein
MNYAISSDPSRGLNWGVVPTTGLATNTPNGFFRPQQLLTDAEPVVAPFVASNSHTDTVSVAITY